MGPWTSTRGVLFVSMGVMSSSHVASRILDLHKFAWLTLLTIRSISQIKTLCVHEVH
jgi:hypothetical protein